MIRVIKPSIRTVEAFPALLLPRALLRWLRVSSTAATAALAEASEPASSQSVDAFASAVAAKLPSPVPGDLSFGPDEAGFVEVPQELIVALESPEPAGALADLAASFMDIKPEEKQEILESVGLVARIDKGRAASLRADKGLAPRQRDRPADQGDVRRETAQDSP
jgi:hypothetical protein